MTVPFVPGTFFHPTHTLLAANPLESGVEAGTAPPGSTGNEYAKGELPVAGSDNWKWLVHKPRQWQPSVRFRHQAVTVTFFTYSPLGQEGIYQHTDTYTLGSYVAKSQSIKIAKGPRHIVF